jgi:hypothetical protein
MAQRWGATQSQRLTLRVFSGRESAGRHNGGPIASSAPILRWLGNGFVDQQNRYVIADRVNPMALPAFQARAVVPDHQRFLAYRTDQNVEKILRDHTSYFTPSGFEVE